MMLRTMIFKRLLLLDRIKLKVLPFFSTSIRKNTLSQTVHNENRKLWKVVFYGTDELSEVTLKALYSNYISSACHKIIESLDVVCVKSDCPVRRYATKNNLTIHTWPYDLPTNFYDVGVVVSFGYLIPAESIHACKYGIINAHPSLLPRWRGAAPIIHTILNGDTETGVTITEVSPNKFDVGKILMQEKYIIPKECSSKTLTNELSKMAANMVINTLQNFPHYIESSYSQSKEGVTYARKIKPEMCYINWEKDSSLRIYRKCKAFEGFFNLYTFWKDMRITILQCDTIENTKKANLLSLVLEESVSPGFCYFHKKRKVIFVKCQDGWCGILSVKIPKRGKISAQDFYNGFMSKENSNGCYFLSNKSEDNK